MQKLITLSVLLVCLGSVAAAAGVPNAISYQGRLTEAGQPVADGSYLVKFIIYDAPSGGTVLWDAGFQTVSTVNGLFTVSLGAAPMPALPAGLFGDTVRYLGITVGVNPEATPRTKLVSVPYAYAARKADSASAANSAAVASSVAWSNVSGKPAGFADGIDDDSGGDITEVIVGDGLKGGGDKGLVEIGVDDTYLQRRVSDIAGTGSAIKGINADGTIVTTPVGSGDITSVTAGTGLSGGGVVGAVTLNLDTLITGNRRFSDTVQFGDSTLTIANSGIGLGRVGSSSGVLVTLLRKYNTVDARWGLFQDLDNSGAGSLYGAEFNVGTTSSSDGGGARYGVHATVNNALSSTSQQIALWGVAGSTAKTAGTSYGVYGAAYAGTGSAAYSVYGYKGGAGTGYAGYFIGDVAVAGTLSKTIGSFKIDHPLDPENQYLQHSFVESPDMMNVYNGNVILGADGSAIVMLPKYFEALNRDFRYQLTAIGAPGPNLFIAEKVNGNQFTIAGGTPRMEVSWQVTGIRQDAYANAHRIEVEVDKPAVERGTYLSPEEHGQPIEKHVNYEQMKQAEEHQAREATEER